ncbi:MAG: response regulator [Desulfamplus sp.]
MNNKTAEKNDNIGKVLVVGAGISGIRSALDLAESGYKVVLAEKTPHIGGILSKLDYQFRNDRCGMCKMLPTANRDSASQYCLRKGLFHDNIEILLSSELISLEGEAGSFKAAFRSKPSLIQADLCIGCGECAAVCPVEVPDSFNSGFLMRKAVYLPVPHKIPNTFMIDTDSCTKCGACEPACPTGAIRFSDQGRKKFNILVVDDELIVRDSLKEWLEDEGYSADMAESGKDALEKLSKKSYHLMLIDIKMPEMDGVTVLKKAKEEFPNLEVLMMTAYATVETAVGAMKLGAMDYLLKPFDTEAVLPKIAEIYENFQTQNAQIVEAQAVILSCGVDFYNPAEGKNTYGYGVYPNVVTSLEFERIVSGTGPTIGKLIRPLDKKPIQKIAWFQCTGSRDLQINADFCSSVCCMYAVKEALLAKRETDGRAETVIFYMDMRTFGKSFQRYRDDAEKEYGVKFVNAKIHSVTPDLNNSSCDLVIRYIDSNGAVHDEIFDMIVLPVGQRPSKDSNKLSEITGIALNSSGFAETMPFFMAQTSKNGIMAGGSFAGFKDISDSVIQASAAAMSAANAVIASGKVRIGDSVDASGCGAMSKNISASNSGAKAGCGQSDIPPELLREPPRIMAALCRCSGTMSEYLNESDISNRLKISPDVSDVVFVDRLCTLEGWKDLVNQIKACNPNRLVVGACMPYLYNRKFREAGSEAETGLNSALVGVADIRSSAYQNQETRIFSNQENGVSQHQEEDKYSVVSNSILRSMNLEIAKVRWINPENLPAAFVTKTALVIGGGIAGMTAALSVSESGFKVYLIEKSDKLGGNIKIFKQTIEGYQVQNFLADTIQKVEKHPLIEIHTQTEVIASFGEVGHFLTTIESIIKNGKNDSKEIDENQKKEVQTIEHGVVILATGGREAQIKSYGYGLNHANIDGQGANISQDSNIGQDTDSNAQDTDKAGTNGQTSLRSIMTQLEFEKSIGDAALKPESLSSVVMIQCAGTREEPRNYCSRVCCATALRQALFLKKENPEITITILYRDIMSYGFSETYYTQARQAGILFIRYTPDRKPVVNLTNSDYLKENILKNSDVNDNTDIGVNDNNQNKVSVRCFEPIIRQDIEIEADVVVLAAGVVPNLPVHLAASFGASIDRDGFFEEAESKWRPVDSLKEGIFACGLAHSPRNIPESIATAQAAAQRAARILSNSEMVSGRITARVRYSICSLCGLCIETCPYGARSFDLERAKVLVNPVMCQGCGACASVCPNKASVVDGFSSQQVFEMIDAVLV